MINAFWGAYFAVLSFVGFLIILSVLVSVITVTDWGYSHSEGWIGGSNMTKSEWIEFSKEKDAKWGKNGWLGKVEENGFSYFVPTRITLFSALYRHYYDWSLETMMFGNDRGKLEWM